MSSSSAVSLIKKLQTVLSDLAPNAVIERLLEHIVQRAGIQRAVLVTAATGGSKVHAVALSEPVVSVQQLNVPLSIMRSLPVDFIQGCLSSGKITFCQRDQFKAPVVTTLKSACCHPVHSGNNVIAVIYLESGESIETLKQDHRAMDALWELTPVWLISALDKQYQASLEEQCRVAEEALKTSEAYLQALMEHAPALISVRDRDGRFVLASRGFDNLLNYSSGMVGRTIFEVLPNKEAKFIWDLDQQVSRSKKSIEYSSDLVHRTLGCQSYQVSKFPLLDEQGEAFAIADVFTNISEHVEAKNRLQEQQSKLNKLAFNDPLTDLPNRTLFSDRLQHALVRADRNQSQVAVMLLDVDRFKNINDSLGHEAGDIMLQVLAQRFSGEMRGTDTLARFGGDEFVVIIEGIHSTEDAVHVATHLLEAAAKPMELREREVKSSVSIGISLYPGDGGESETLLKHADLAMYKAKAEGKNRFHFYQEGMNQAAVNTLLLENDLRQAIQEGQLQLNYQPQMDLESETLSGMEVLVRWQHPERGLISPVQFIGLAEEAGLISSLGDWVLRAACRQLRVWLDAGFEIPKMAVNISLRQLKGVDFVASVQSILDETGLEPRFLELEITESSAMENADQTIRILSRLSEMGVSLSIDDFGTGYSSLAYLKRFPINKLKIDRSFVCEITDNTTDEAIANSIVALAHSMNLVVVAEGVERVEEVKILRGQGCDQAQGYYYAKPLTADLLESRFKKGKFELDSSVVNLES